MSNNNNEFYPQTEQLDKLEQIYNQGQYLTAYHQAVQLAPLRCWRGKQARLLAARIARMMNQTSLSKVLFYRAWKEHPEDADTVYELARNKRSQGLYFAWRFIQRYDQSYTKEPQKLARWLALKGNIAAHFRNFKQADEYIRQALVLSDEPWVRCEQAYILEFEDRYEESLDVIEQLFKRNDNYRPAYQQKAFLLQLMRRDEEARQCLAEAYNRFESIHVGVQWLDELIEDGDFEKALAVSNELDAFAVSKRRHEFDWLQGRKVDILCHLGQYEQAGELVSGIESKFYSKVAENLLKAGSDSRRNVLPVSFIRQQHNTCGPATMSAICHYHGSVVEQQSIIDSIWYAGTNDVDERRWCLENNWQVQEFTLTWDSVRRLIDAGFPVAVSTVEPDSAHLQAVIGYDEFRGSLLIRDPYEREEQEYLADGFLKDYAVHGPRALLIYPQHKAEMLKQCELPESEQYDAFFQLQSALAKHQRADALVIKKKMELNWPDSRMSFLARRRVGYYDGDAAYTLAALERLLELYPDDAGLQLRKQDMLYQLGYVSERKQYLDSVYATGEMHNAIELDYVELLLQDRRHSPRVYSILKRLLAQRPSDPLVYFRLASLRWMQRLFDDSLELYQIAANLAEHDEFYALKYFNAARSLHRDEEVVDWLLERHDAGLGKSSSPAITLYKAMSQLDREHEGFAYLEQAREHLDEDGSLLSFLCSQYIESGRLSDAGHLLKKMKGHVREVDWLISSALLSEQKQDFQEALGLRKTVAELQPQREDYQKSYASLLGQLHGYEDMIGYLQSQVEKYPDSFDLYELLYDSMEQATAVEKETLLHKLLGINSDYAWAWREIAIQQGLQLKLSEAFDSIARAESLDPHNQGLYSCRASLHIKSNDIASARSDYLKALSFSIDATYAANRLLDISVGIEEKREALSYIRQQLIEQVSNGDAILAYPEMAGQVLPAQEVMQHLQEALEARPDLWEAWSAIMSQCQDMQLYGQAEEYAQQACDRFPYVPRLLMERARNFRLQGEYEKEKVYLQQALEINPNYLSAIRSLSENMEHQGEYEEALALLSLAVQHHQLDEVMHGYLADIQWRMGMEQEALKQITEALELEPNYSWGWGKLKEWSDELGRGEEAESLAARVLKQRPGDSRAWFQMSRLAQNFERSRECIEQAIELTPGDISYCQEQIKILVNADAYQEALQAYHEAEKKDLTRDVDLQIYYPWILRNMGKLDEAVEKLQQIMQQHPEHTDGWRVLTRWARAQKDEGLELSAAEQYASYEAHDVDALTSYAKALMKQGAIEKALQQYEKALALEPNDVDANLKLFDLYLEHEHFQRAESLIHHMQLHLDVRKNSYIDARIGQLYSKQGKKDAAMLKLEELAHGKESNVWLIESILEKMEEQGWLNEAEEKIDIWVKDIEKIAPCLTKVWAKRQSKEDDWLVSIESINHLMATGEAGVNVVDAYLDYLIRKEEISRFLTYVDRNEISLRTHDLTWSTVAYHYAGLGLYDEAISWMEDWQQRVAPRSWAMDSLAQSYLEQHYWKKCFEVCRYSISLPDEGGMNSIRVWLALEYAIRGEMNNLYNQLSQIDKEEFSKIEAFSYTLIELMIYYNDNGNQKDIETELEKRLEKIQSNIECRTSQRMYRRVCYDLASKLTRFPRNLFLFYRFYM